ncbi:MAG: PEP-CTERM sorting domain-containing protein [Planctomycetota bacterium]
MSADNQASLYVRFTNSESVASAASGSNRIDNISITSVPEPSTVAMALAGIACGGFSMWRRRKRA